MILIVDDDARIRNAAADILSAQGYKIITAADGAEALKICAARAEIDLIISDVVMPRLSGPHFVAQAKQLRPDLRVIYVSGSLGDIPRDALGDHPLLAKPFTATILVQAVTQALSS